MIPKVTLSWYSAKGFTYICLATLEETTPLPCMHGMGFYIDLEVFTHIIFLHKQFERTCILNRGRWIDSLVNKSSYRPTKRLWAFSRRLVVTISAFYAFFVVRSTRRVARFYSQSVPIAASVKFPPSPQLLNTGFLGLGTLAIEILKSHPLIWQLHVAIQQHRLNATYQSAKRRTPSDPHRHRRHINRDVIYPFEGGGKKEGRIGGR